MCARRAWGPRWAAGMCARRAWGPRWAAGMCARRAWGPRWPAGVSAAGRACGPRLIVAGIAGVLGVLQGFPVRLVLGRERGQFLGQDVLLAVPVRPPAGPGRAAGGDGVLRVCWHLVTSHQSADALSLPSIPLICSSSHM